MHFDRDMTKFMVESMVPPSVLGSVTFRSVIEGADPRLTVSTTLSYVACHADQNAYSVKDLK